MLARRCESSDLCVEIDNRGLCSGQLEYPVGHALWNRKHRSQLPALHPSINTYDPALPGQTRNINVRFERDKAVEHGMRASDLIVAYGITYRSLL